MDVGEAVVGLVVDLLESGDGDTTGRRAARRCAVREARGVGGSNAARFANAGPDCYWRTITGTPLSISDISIDRSSGVVRLAVEGELDLSTAGQLASALGSHLSAGHRTVCVDVSGLTFCGVSGLESLLAAHRAYQASGSVLIITGPGRHLTRYLAMTGLDRILHVVTPSMPVVTGHAHPEG